MGRIEQNTGYTNEYKATLAQISNGMARRSKGMKNEPLFISPWYIPFLLGLFLQPRWVARPMFSCQVSVMAKLGN